MALVLQIQEGGGFVINSELRVTLARVGGHNRLLIEGPKEKYSVKRFKAGEPLSGEQWYTKWVPQGDQP